MSQEKVDRRKYVKKNRKKLEKQRKIKTALKCIAVAIITGAIFGVPLGIRIYKAQPKFVGDSVLSGYVSNYIDENHAADVPSFTSEEDAVKDAATKATEEASDTQDEAVENDSKDSSETTENSQE